MFNKGHLSEGALRSLLGILVQQIESVKAQEEYKSIQHNSLPVRRMQKAFLHFIDKYLGRLNFVEQMRLEYIVLSYEESWGHYHACREVLKDLEKLESLTGIEDSVVNSVRAQYQHWQLLAEESINQMSEQYPEFVSAMQERLGMRLILLAEVQAIRDEASHGNLPHAMAEQMEDDLYLRLWSLRGQEITRLRVDPGELLKKVPFFAETSEEDFLALSKKMKRHSIAGGETVISQGERGDRLYLIARGVVRVSRVQDGESRDLTSLFAGDFFGEMDLLHDEVRSATVVSVTPCTFYVLERKDVQEVMAIHPSIKIALERADQRRRMEQLSMGSKQDSD